MHLDETEEEILALCLDTGGGPMTALIRFSDVGRNELQPILDRLVDRGLLRHERGWYAGPTPNEDGELIYEDDYWVVTEDGRSALGLGPGVIRQAPIDPGL